MSDRTLRVVQVGGEWSGTKQGGGNRYFSGLLHALPKNGVDCLGMAVGLPGACDPPGTSVGTLEDSLIRRSLQTKRSVADVVAADSIDAVVSHFAPYGLAAMQVAQRAGLPTIVHFHGPWADEAAAEGGGRISVALKRLIERRVYRQADQLVTLSNAFKRVLIERYGIDEQRIAVVPGGIDAGRWREGSGALAPRSKFSLPTSRPVVLCVRRLARRMGLDLLIEAAAEVRASVPEVLFVIAGRGPIEGELRVEIERRGLGEHVMLLGFVPDDALPALYRSANLTVVPSRSLEGFGLVTLESLATGTPVLVTPVGGLPEAVAGLDAGLVLDEPSVACLASGILRALRQPETLPAAEQCERYVRENFDWPIIAGRVAAVYRAARVAGPRR